jgi:acetate kinase
LTRETGRPFVLAINGGSSSIRFAMYDTGQTPRRALAGKIDRIGSKDTRLTVEAPGGTSAGLPPAAAHPIIAPW